MSGGEKPYRKMLMRNKTGQRHYMRSYMRCQMRSEDGGGTNTQDEAELGNVNYVQSRSCMSLRKRDDGDESHSRRRPLTRLFIKRMESSSHLHRDQVSSSKRIHNGNARNGSLELNRLSKTSFKSRSKINYNVPKDSSRPMRHVATTSLGTTLYSSEGTEESQEIVRQKPFYREVTVARNTNDIPNSSQKKSALKTFFKKDGKSKLSNWRQAIQYKSRMKKIKSTSEDYSVESVGDEVAGPSDRGRYSRPVDFITHSASGESTRPASHKKSMGVESKSLYLGSSSLEMIAPTLTTTLKRSDQRTSLSKVGKKFIHEQKYSATSISSSENVTSDPTSVGTGDKIPATVVYSTEVTKTQEKRSRRKYSSSSGSKDSESISGKYSTDNTSQMVTPSTDPSFLSKERLRTSPRNSRPFQLTHQETTEEEISDSALYEEEENIVRSLKASVTNFSYEQIEGADSSLTSKNASETSSMMMTRAPQVYQVDAGDKEVADITEAPGSLPCGCILGVRKCDKENCEAHRLAALAAAEAEAGEEGEEEEESEDEDVEGEEGGLKCECKLNQNFCHNTDCKFYRPKDDGEEAGLADTDATTVANEIHCTCYPCRNPYCSCKSTRVQTLAEPYLQYVPSIDKLLSPPPEGTEVTPYDDAIVDEQIVDYDEITGKYMTKKQLIGAIIKTLIYVFLVFFAILGALSSNPMSNFAMGNDLRNVLSYAKFLHVPIEAEREWEKPVYEIDETFYDVSTMREFWEYMQQIYGTLLYSQTGWKVGGKDGNERKRKQRRYVLGENRVMGPIRIRQKRVSGESCETHYSVSGKFFECYAQYNIIYEDKTLHGEAGVEGSEFVPGIGDWYRGQIADYNPGGFHVDLQPADLYDRFAALRAANWIDRSTRVMFITMTLINGNINRHCIVNIVVEKPANGGVEMTLKLLVSDFTRYSGPDLGYNMAVDGMAIVMLVAKLVIELRAKLVVLRWGYFTKFWNGYTLTMLIFGLYFYVNQFMVYMRLNAMLDEFKEDTMYIDFEKHYDSLETVIDCRAILIFLLWCRLSKYFIMNVQLRFIDKVLSEAYSNLVKFSLVFLVFIVAFAQFGKIVFGTQAKSFRTFGTGFKTMLNAVIGNFDYNEIKYANAFIAPIFFIGFIITIIFVIMNMYVAIIAEGYARFKGEFTTEHHTNLWRYMNNQHLKRWLPWLRVEPRTTWIRTLRKEFFTDAEILKIIKNYGIKPTRGVNKNRLKSILEDESIVPPDQRMRRVRSLKQQLVELQNDVIDTEYLARRTMRELDDMLFKALVAVDKWTETRMTPAMRDALLNVGWKARLKEWVFGKKKEDCCINVKCLTPEAMCTCGQRIGRHTKECLGIKECEDIRLGKDRTAEEEECKREE